MGLKMTPEQEALAQRLFATDLPDHPKTLGGCVDAYYRMRGARLKLDKQIKEMKAEEELLKSYIFQEFGDKDIDGAKGRLATCSVTRSTVAQVTDWDLVHRHVSNQDEWDLLIRRINDAAYRERLMNNEVIPGIQPFEVVNLSFTKRKGT